MVAARRLEQTEMMVRMAAFPAPAALAEVAVTELPRCPEAPRLPMAPAETVAMAEAEAVPAAMVLATRILALYPTVIPAKDRRALMEATARTASS